MHEDYYWLGFSYFHGIGPLKFQLLLKSFWTAENAWNATKQELLHSGIGQKVTEDFLDFRQRFHVEAYAEQLQKSGVSYVLQNQTAFPNLLKQIPNAPFVLYTKGNKTLLQQDEKQIYIAVVGTRKVTDYGRHVTEMITDDLARNGFVIVSGLAMGIDAIAHAATLRAEGKTIAVLGCGVDCCTPRENEWLYQKIIAEDGVIISEAPLGQSSFKGSFPSRNRIIAGLSHGTLVTEGAEDSGSLITANDALKFGRLVYAVPGPITSSVSRGPIALIGKGAKMVISAKDIVQSLGLQFRNKDRQKIVCDSADEQAIIDLLEMQPMHFDEIVRQTGLHSAHVGTLLSIMEVKGAVRTTESGAFTVV